MICHQTEPVECHAASVELLPDESEHLIVVARIAEQLPAVVAAKNNVVGDTREDGACGSRHARLSARHTAR